VANGRAAMPLTAYQEEVARLLSTNRTSDSYLAGGAAIHLKPNTRRYSNDLDYFHDSVERVAEAFGQDRQRLHENGHGLVVDMTQPGYIRATVSRGGASTKVEWAHDSAWRFMPTVRSPTAGYSLHPVDLAINKLLALVGRDEPRDFLDMLDLHDGTLHLGALCWAAAGKDPGFTPLSILDILRRRGRYQPEDFARLKLDEPADLPALKARWLEALSAAESFIRSRPPEEAGCLYYSPSLARFVAPGPEGPDDAVPHYGRPGGVLPACLQA